MQCNFNNTKIYVILVRKEKASVAAAAESIHKVLNVMKEREKMKRFC